MLNLRLIVLSGILLTLAACASAPTSVPPVEDRTPAPDSPSVPVPDTTQRPSAPQPAAPTPPPVSSPAVIALLEDTQQYSQQGDFQAAQTRIQRAQRIAPRDPKVYYDLAQTHYQLKDYRLSEQVALRGVSYTQNDPALLKRFWLLIADVRQKAGNRSGAKAAREQAARY